MDQVYEVFLWERVRGDLTSVSIKFRWLVARDVKYRRDETEHQTLAATKVLNPVFGEM